MVKPDYLPNANSLFDLVKFNCEPAMKNRFMPLTNLQSHADGRMPEDEFNWLAIWARDDAGASE